MFQIDYKIFLFLKATGSKRHKDIRKHCSRCKQHEMAEHKADTFNMFKSLVKHFPEYNEVLSLEIVQQGEDHDHNNISKSKQNA